MAFAIIAIPVFILLSVVNWYLRKRGKKHISERLTLPMVLFLIMCYLAYDFKSGFLEVLIFFGFGLIIGSYTERVLMEEKAKK
jgi:hypothetical protein